MDCAHDSWVFRPQVLKVRQFLVVSNKHHGIYRIFQELGHQFFLDIRAGLVDIVEGHLGRSLIEELILSFLIDEVDRGDQVFEVASVLEQHSHHVSYHHVEGKMLLCFAVLLQEEVLIFFYYATSRLVVH